MFSVLEIQIRIKLTNEDLYNIDSIVDHTIVQRRPTTFVLCVHVCTAFDHKSLHNLDVTLLCGVMQRRLTKDVLLCVRICTAFDHKSLHDLDVTIFCSEMKRRPT